METRVLIQNPKTFCSLFPTPVKLHIKSDQDWPTGLRDIQVWKCGRRWTDGPLVYYKLTSWAFGSGELKMLTYISYSCVKAPGNTTALSWFICECDLNSVNCQGWTTGVVTSVEVGVQLLERLTDQLISLSNHLGTFHKWATAWKKQ